MDIRRISGIVGWRAALLINPFYLGLSVLICVCMYRPTHQQMYSVNCPALNHVARRHLLLVSYLLGDAENARHDNMSAGPEFET